MAPNLNCCSSVGYISKSKSPSFHPLCVPCIHPNYKHISTVTHAHTHTHTLTYTDTHTHTHIYTQTHTYTHTHTWRHGVGDSRSVFDLAPAHHFITGSNLSRTIGYWPSLWNVNGCVTLRWPSDLEYESMLCPVPSRSYLWLVYISLFFYRRSTC